MHLFYILLVIFVASIVGFSSESINDDDRNVYIIYMGSLPEGEYLARSYHVNMLQALGHTNKMVKKILIRSYTRSFNGFAVNLTQSEVLKLRNFDEVVSVFKSHQLQTQTTRSWDYLGLPIDVSRNPTIESDIIIGHFDSGVRLEADSFSDHGLSGVPKKWKGVCHGGKNFICNKKLIGARYYTKRSTKNYIDGHGTHTASIVAGNMIKNTSFFGIANGTARGGVPSARIATYTVCDNGFCEDHDILAAFDDAIADNVDIITISIAGNPTNMSDDAISIGSFHAIEKDILTVHAAGNYVLRTNSMAPWLFSVGASSDRQFFNKLILGNGHTLLSTVVDSFDQSNHNIQLLYGRGVSRSCNESFARQCMLGCVDSKLVKGKIILCDADSYYSDAINIAATAGANGVIVRENFETKDDAIVVTIPTAILNEPDFRYVESYLKSKSFHSARIIRSDIVRNRSPILASFSSKGPNTILPEIFKPDIVAPGVNILAAYPPKLFIAPRMRNFHRLNANYQFLSGTSMACPLAAGAAAYVKSKHPKWSASAIKSSLMTTAWNMNGKYNLNAELGHGAGQINPIKAIYPGLVYETFIDDYFKMFCSLGSEGDKLTKILKGKRKCRKGIKTYPKDLSYPAMTSLVHQNSSFKIQFFRVVTNVGHANSTYHAEISTGDNTIYINVEPNILSFVKLKERKSFVVTVTGQWLNQDHISCSLIWFDETHRVRSPVFLYESSLF